MEPTKVKPSDLKLEIAQKVLGRTSRLNQSQMIKMRRTIGLTADKLSPDEKIVFYSLFPADTGVPSDHYFVNCILFGVQVACLQERNLVGNEQLKDVVADAYNNAPSATAQRKIEAFMSSDGYGNVMFFKNLGYMVMPLLKKHTVNVFNLTEDLIKWDQYGKDRWLKAIVKIKQSRTDDNTGAANNDNTDTVNDNNTDTANNA